MDSMAVRCLSTLLVVGAMSCLPRWTDAPAEGASPLVPVDLQSGLAREITTLLASAPGRRLAGEPVVSPKALAAAYAGREGAPRWVDSDLARARRGLAALELAAAHGYRPAAYHAEAVASRLGEPPLLDATHLAEADVLLTDGFAALGAHLWAGRLDPATLDPGWHARREGFDVADTLARAQTADPVSVLEGLLPKAAGYRRLTEQLARLRQVEAQGGWPEVPPDASLAEGSGGWLAVRLVAMGDLASTEDLATGDLPDALARFQRRHGLAVTRHLDPPTRVALQVPLALRIRTVRVNLERWRWLPDVLGERHIRVNIAEFRLEAREADEVALEMDVVVGRESRQTPVFSSTMERVVFNPAWNVPSGIASKDVIPAVRRDRGYLARKGIQVIEGRGAEARVVDPSTIDWASASTRTVSFRQPPGPNNALGRVKLLFPNPYAVYLHDTPSKELFGETRRDFSSGCVRLSRPLDLAAWVLLGQPEADAAAIDAVLARGKETSITPRRPPQVHLQYATAWVDDQGVRQWRVDIYGRDAKVAEALGVGP